MKDKLWRMISLALRFTGDGFYQRVTHYLPLWRGKWPGILHLRNPKTLSEKLQYLSLHIDRLIPDAHLYADKLRVREYVGDTVGKEYLVPLLGIWDVADEIPWSDLPDRFAVKTNHGAGFNILVHDRAQLDVSRATKQLNAWLETDWGRLTHENQYRRIPRRIFAEALLGSGGEDVPDYKFWCFGGRCEFLEVDIDRSSSLRQLFVDTDWNPLPAQLDGRTPDSAIPRPTNLDRMVTIAERLSSPFVFVTVDLYEVDGLIYFGELSFSAPGPLTPPEWNRKLGEILDLPR